jgi:hypothetical protein
MTDDIKLSDEELLDIRRKYRSGWYTVPIIMKEYMLTRQQAFEIVSPVMDADRMELELMWYIKFGDMP